MTGILDIGSNTVRLVMYEKGKKTANYAMTSEIINDTADGCLTSAGIARLCAMLETLKQKAEGCEIYAIATYAFRILKNCEEVKKEIYSAVGIEVDILSGEEEAKYDFYGLMGSINKNESGIGVDLGGGSAQIFKFREGKLEFHSSYPIGCRKMKNKFCGGITPTKAERAELEKYIEEKLKDFSGECSKIYMMGGTAKTAAKLYSFLNGSENVDILKTAYLDGLVRFIGEAPEEAMKNILHRRYDNISVGIITMKKIAEIAKAGEIHIKKCGVREGYLMKKKENPKTPGI